MNVQRLGSDIHGVGVFAVDPISEEDWTPIYGEFEPKSRRNEGRFDRFEHDEEWDFVPYKPWCWLNHRDTPNCEVRGEGSLSYIVALRDIDAGEELTIDYGDDWKD